MEAETKQEIEALKLMLTHWIEDYKRHITPHGSNAYLLEDFETEINENMIPHIRRLLECGFCESEDITPIFKHANECVKSFIEEEQKIQEEALYAKDQKDDERKTIADFLRIKLDFDSFIIAGFREKDFNQFQLTGDSELGPFVYVNYGKNPEAIVYLLYHILKKEPAIKEELLRALNPDG